MAAQYPARKKAMDLLLRMDRTEKNLRDKLKEKEFSEEEIEDAICYVKGFHYLDDRRYAETYIRFHENTKSRSRLRQDLLKKGVERELADQTLSECYEGDEEAQIRVLLQKKGYLPSMDFRGKQKIYGFLMRRGFSSVQIAHAMGGIKDLNSCGSEP